MGERGATSALEIYRIPRREVQVRILLDDGRSLDGTLFTSQTLPGSRPDDVLRHLNDATEDFVPLLCGADSFLLNKAGIIWVQLAGEAAEEIVTDSDGGRRVPARLTLAGGLNLLGTLAVVMPPGRTRVIDYLNAAGRFVPLFDEGRVTLVRRSFIVSIRCAEGPGRAA